MTHKQTTWFLRCTQCGHYPISRSASCCPNPQCRLPKVYCRICHEWMNKEEQDEQGLVLSRPLHRACQTRVLQLPASETCFECGTHNHLELADIEKALSYTFDFDGSNSRRIYKFACRRCGHPYWIPSCRHCELPVMGARYSSKGDVQYHTLCGVPLRQPKTLSRSSSKADKPGNYPKSSSSMPIFTVLTVMVSAFLLMYLLA